MQQIYLKRECKAMWSLGIMQEIETWPYNQLYKHKPESVRVNGVLTTLRDFEIQIT